MVYADKESTTMKGPRLCFAARSMRFAFAGFTLLAVGGCATANLQYPTLDSGQGEPRRVELENTPFHPQAAYQCGPAALATLLESSGVSDADPDRLADQVYLPGLRGSLQTELLGASRRADRVPYRLQPRLADLLAEVRAGHPVLVLQNLRLSGWPLWHYAVVIGFDLDAEKVVLRSGETRRQEMSFRHFERTWRLADYWALVIAKPGDLPATASAPGYVDAVAVLEQQQRYAAAITGYEAARERWPAYPMSYLGLGNIAYRQDDFQRAADHFRAAVRAAPAEPAAHYNLAWAYLRQGKTAEALESAYQAEALAPDHLLYRESVSVIARAAEAGQEQEKKELNEMAGTD